MATSGKTVAVIGSGMVGQALANGLNTYGYDVTIASRDGKQVEGWAGKVGKFAEVVAPADIAVLAVKGSAAEDVVRSMRDQVSGKTVIDVTNPIADAPPENGVLRFFTDLDHSLMERLQQIAPGGRFVKAFNSTGASTMVNPDYGGTKPSMFICGNDPDAKREVS